VPVIVEMKVKNKKNAFGDEELAGCQSAMVTRLCRVTAKDSI
jgi:hypothetical protein